MFDYKKFPILETERLRLREITLKDRHAIFAIRNDYEVTKYNSGAAYVDIQQADQLIMGISDEYRNRKSVRWGITHKSDDIVMGMVGFNYWDARDNRGSVGFDLARVYWRKGIMSEAVGAILRFGFMQMALNRIEADASIYNTASINLLLKLGFAQEGHQREQYYEDGEYHDLLLFALLKRHWQHLQEG